MSNNDPKDSEEERAAETGSQIEDAEIVESTPAPGRAADSRRGPSRIPLVLAVVAILLVLGGLGLGYQYTSGLQVSLQQMDQSLAQAAQQQQQLQAQLGGIESAFQTQKEEIEKQRQALSEQDSKLAQERERLDQQAEEMQQTLESVYSRVGRSSNAWMAAEAGYLMRIANHRLQLERDLPTAIRALQGADARLRDTGDPGWTRVREVLASEIAELEAVKPLDLTGLSARLSGLAGQVGELKMVGLQYTPSQPEAAKAEQGGEERSINTLLKDGWEGFKSVMVIRHRDKPVSAMLAPEQQFFVYENLQLQLQAARLALLKGDQALYTSSLKQAAEWTGEFFDPETSATRAMQAALAELQGVELRPALPDISRSLAALQQRMEQVEAEGAQ
ncbi:MAG: uroporphyrinogen-III C-methyltransferase [Sedimenticola sp.]|nr:uroporphyrinogen-III C-methyltransferase [Sedimenticola sp.]